MNYDTYTINSQNMFASDRYLACQMAPKKDDSDVKNFDFLKMLLIRRHCQLAGKSTAHLIFALFDLDQDGHIDESELEAQPSNLHSLKKIEVIVEWSYGKQPPICLKDRKDGFQYLFSRATGILYFNNISCIIIMYTNQNKKISSLKLASIQLGFVSHDYFPGCLYRLELHDSPLMKQRTLKFDC